MVNGCCCKEIYRFPHNTTYPYSTCISSFFASASLLLCSFLNVFSYLFMLFLCNIANVAQRTFRSFKNRDHANLAIYGTSRKIVLKTFRSVCVAWRQRFPKKGVKRSVPFRFTFRSIARSVPFHIFAESSRCLV